jgi:hypothetical protein
MAATSASAPDRRSVLWNSLFVADFNVRYWRLVSDRYVRRNEGFSLIMRLGTSGIMGLGLWQHFPVVVNIVTVLLCITTWLYPTFCPTDRMTKAAALQGAWRKVKSDYQNLWDFDVDLTSPESWKQFQDTKKTERNIDETGIPEDKKLKQEAWEELTGRKGP